MNGVETIYVFLFSSKQKATANPGINIEPPSALVTGFVT